MNIIEKVRRHGIRGSARLAARIFVRKSGYLNWRIRNAPVYASPTETELATIERDLAGLGIEVHDFAPNPEEFEKFKADQWFPSNYHGGAAGGVWDEKLLEHWLSSQLLGVMNYEPGDIYVDVAAATSPWVRQLRERANIQAFAIDLSEVAEAYRSLPYYRVEDATQSTFATGSVKGASLHCAYEMFMRDSDTRFISEAARILKPGGKVVILPLYMHTHYCAYSTPEYFGKKYPDYEAKQYVRPDGFGVPSSRKYDAAHLKARVLDPITRVGMKYRLRALRNKAAFGSGIYCHFILEIEQPERGTGNSGMS